MTALDPFLSNSITLLGPNQRGTYLPDFHLLKPYLLFEIMEYKPYTFGFPIFSVLSALAILAISWHSCNLFLMSLIKSL